MGKMRDPVKMAPIDIDGMDGRPICPAWVNPTWTKMMIKIN